MSPEEARVALKSFKVNVFLCVYVRSEVDLLLSFYLMPNLSL